MRFHNTKFVFSAVFLVSLLLSACGGGDTAPVVTPPPPPPLAAITAQPTDQSAVAGTAATFSVVATDASSYQWQRSTDGGASFSNVSAATGASHTTAVSTVLDNGTKYRVVVAGLGNSVTSSAATLTVTPAVLAPSISVQPAAQSITAGQNASFSVTAAGTALTYQWQRSTDGGTSFANLAGASNATLTLTALALADNAQQFRAAVSNSAGSVTSNAALLTVKAASVAAAFTLHPSNQSVTAPATATFTAAATGTPTPTLQWQESAAGSWSDIAGATASSYTTPATSVGDSGKQYRVMATNTTANVTSNAASLTVRPAPVAPSFTTQPANVTITAGQSAQFTVAASGTPTPTLQWQLSTDGGASFSNIVGATGTVFNVINAAQGNNGRQFRAVASNGVGPAVNSNAATLTVTAASPVTITTTSPLPDATVNTPYSVSLAATGGVTPYVWSLASGTMPPGFSLNPSTGVFSGSGSTGSINYNLNIQVTDSAIPAQSSQGYFSLNVQPICDVGLGSATVANPPAASFGGKFCPQTKTPPGALNLNGDVSATWFESYSYPSANYLQSVSVTFNPLTGAVYSVVYYLNDPTHLASLLCSRETFSPPPCAGVTVNVGTGLVTLINTVVGTGGPATLNGLLQY